MKTLTENVLVFLLILSLPLLLYFNSLNGTTLWEDESLILDNRLTRDASNLFRLFNPSFWSSYHLSTYKDYRPVFLSTFIIENALIGGSVRTYRLGNIAIYSFTALLLYVLVNLLSSSKKIALAAALLFASHPVHVEAVVWIKNRSELLAAFFMILSLIAFTKMCLSSKRRTTLFTASLLASIIAILSKESALVIPLILCAVLLYLRREERTAIKASILVPYLISSTAFYLFKKLASPHGRMGDALSYLPSPYSRTAIAVKTIGSYFRLLLLPTDLSIQHVSPSIGYLIDPDFLLSLAVIFAFSLALIVTLRLHRFLAFALSWIILCLIPISNIIVMFPGRPVAEQRLFFPSAGFSIALACILFPKKGKISRWILLTAIVTCYGALTINRNRDWLDKKRIMERALAVSPGSWKAGIDLASISFKEGNYASAFRYASIPAKEYTNLTDPYRHIAALYGKMGHLRKAEGYYKLALKIDQDDYLAHDGLGSIYSKAGKYELARWEYRISLRHWPQPAPILANIGWTYEKEGSLEKAERYYREAIRHYPDFKNAHCDLGRVLYKLERMDESRRAFSEAIEIDKRYAPAHRGLGEIEMAKGQYERAREHFERALALSPGKAEVLNSIAISYKKEGDLRKAFTHYRAAFLSDPVKSSYLDSLLDTYRMIDSPSLRVELSQALIGASRKCLASGHEETAKAYLETLLQIDHGNTEAREMIMELYSRGGEAYLLR